MASPAPAGRQVDLTELNVQQLNQLGQQLEKEAEFLNQSMTQLKLAQDKFNASYDSLKTISPTDNGNEVLVPLTTSMYIPGKLDDLSTALIDIGTGYYLEKNVKGAEDYFQRKIQFLSSQIDTLQPNIMDKVKLKQMVTEVLQMKIQSQLSSQMQGSSIK